MNPVYTHFVAGIYPLCGRYIPTLWQVYTHSVAGIYLCDGYIPLWQVNTSVAGIYPLCGRYIPAMLVNNVHSDLIKLWYNI